MQQQCNRIIRQKLLTWERMLNLKAENLIYSQNYDVITALRSIHACSLYGVYLSIESSLATGITVYYYSCKEHLFSYLFISPKINQRRTTFKTSHEISLVFLSREMLLSIHRCSLNFIGFLYFFVCSDCVINNVSNNCHQLWHFFRNGRCCCGITNDYGMISCDEQFIHVKQGTCMTWDNATSSAEFHHCLFTKWSEDKCIMNDVYRISTSSTGEKLNQFTCGDYNRQRKYCSQCIDGYGPAVFSDDATCADCSKHKYLWILNLMFQLLMVTILCWLLMFFQIKGTSSPFNVVIMCAQLVTMGLKLDSDLHARLSCYIGHTLTSIVITGLGVFNLDFFHALIPPLCVSPSLKSINILLFEYIIASYPLFLTMFIYLSIEIYDRKQTLFCRYLLTNCFKIFNTSWNPKRTILNTFATFLLLSYSKLLFTSIHLLLAFQSYNMYGEKVLSSPLLLYDPSIRLFHAEHIPYAVIALLIILIFIILPPILLLVYPTAIFKKCLTCLGFQRWDILQHIMDIFQGWYKDGTEGSGDYRSLSALYLFYRVVLSFAYAFQTLLSVTTQNKYRFPRVWLVLGLSNAFLGTAYFMLQP